MNFSKNVEGKGIGAGSWWIPSWSEMARIIYPNYEKIRYACSLVGLSLSNTLWTSTEVSEARAGILSYSLGCLFDTPKGDRHGLILVAEPRIQTIS